MKKYFTLLLVSFFTIFSLEVVKASHITGGEMTYVCNSTGSYDVTMILYRDCQGIDLPTDVTLNIYRHDNGTTATGAATVLNSSAFIFDDFDDPCATVPPGNCVEMGIYIFEDVDIPLSTTGFVEIYYQTTALSSTYINNVLNASSFGITVNALIPPLTTNTCHDSPVFDAAPPLIICLNLPSSIDVSATASDPNNTLEYEYFAPYDDSPTLPLLWDEDTNDFDTITWDVGFSTQDPFGVANGTNMIVSPTGYILGTPGQEAHFYVGVRVKEYDSDGNLLSVISRTFTYIVVNCNITTSIIEMSEAPSCGELTIDFINSSTNSDEFFWEFGDTAVVDTSNNTSILEDPVHTYSEFGEYTVTLISYTDDIACADTASLTFTLYDALPATIEPNGPQCLTSNSFDFISTITGSEEYSVLWEFAGGATPSTSNELNPTDVVFSTAGDHLVTLNVYYKDCITTVLTSVNVFDGLLDEIQGPNYACDPETVTFQGATSNPDYEYTWYIAGDTLYGASVDYFFDESGYYDVALYVFDPSNGCESLQEIDDYIQVFPTPFANFEISDQAFTIGEQFQMWDKSIDATSVTYSIVTDGFFTTQLDPLYVFNTPGEHIIVQNVLNGQCTDSHTVNVSVSPREPEIPNVFSPNGDLINDFFTMETFHNENVQVNIFDRWGSNVYTSDSYELCAADNGDFCWNGDNQSTGKRCKKGTYFYIVKLRTGESYKGTVNLF